MPLKLKIETIAIEKVLPYARNARLHSEEQILAISKSIEEFGFCNPCLIDASGVLIAGHGRVSALKLLDRPTVPVIRLGHLTETQAKALRLADNALPEQAAWSTELLRVELNDLKDAGYDMPVIGFTPQQLVSFMSEKSAADPEAIPEAPKHPSVRRGDVWVLGNHRIVVGDATLPESWNVLFGRDKAALVFTDPPYGVSYEAASGKFGVIEGDHKRRDDLYKMLTASLREMARHATDTAAFYIWHACMMREDFAQAMKAVGIVEKSYLIWVKPAHPFGRADYQWQYEPCQPAGTMVHKVTTSQKGRNKASIIARVAIETLKVGDRVVSFDPYAGVLKQMGREVTKHGSRQYSGNMHTIQVGANITKATADHRFTVRFNAAGASKSVVYLMRRGDRWRVGVVRLFNSRGFGLAVRLYDEKAEAAWILAAHDDPLDARVAEQVYSCLYGIPTTHWEFKSGHPHPERMRSKKQIEQIYQQIGADHIGLGARQLLLARGLSLRDPFITDETDLPYSRRKTLLLRARNLVPGIMEVPCSIQDKVRWEAITGAEFSHFNGKVYSMDVATNQHYVADNIVTHNCFYGSKADHSPEFYGKRTETTVWHVQMASAKETAATVGSGLILLDGEGASLYVQSKAPKNKKLRQVRITKDTSVYLTGSDRQDGTVWEVARDPNHEHPTQKPVELARRAIENSSKPGEIVTDGFLGSGTTLIGAEMTARRCFATEIDPVYAEVAIRRWERFTGDQARLEATDQTLDDVVKSRRKPAQTASAGRRTAQKKKGAAT